MPTDTKQRMVSAAMALFQRHGYRATSWRTLTKAGGTPWGSVRHHFPGGKEEIGVAALALASRLVDQLIGDCLARSDTPAKGICLWFSLSARLLADSDFDSGCPVAPVVLEMSSDSPVLRAACADALSSWVTTIADALQGAGMTEPRAEQLATTAVATFEGAMILARARRDTEPVEQASRTMTDLLGAELSR